MNSLSTESRGRVIGCLVEDMSIRATVRATGVAKTAIVTLLADLGEACSHYRDLVMGRSESARLGDASVSANLDQ